MMFYWIQRLSDVTMTAETYQVERGMIGVDGEILPLNSSVYNYTAVDSGDGGRLTTNDSDEPSHDYGTRSVPEIVVVVVVVVALSVITSAGNLLVIVSFKVDVQLQTVSNYFLLSLSVADLTIGLVSMPLYSVYLLMGYWPLGHVVCDAWLSLDYTMSNASVANLLVISFDRYFSVTRPLTYRVRRTSGRAAVMIAGAWTVSALLWTPWIVAWPHLEGRRTVPPLECYVQFLKTNKYFTIMTATAAFYLPVLIMSVLYFRIYRETEKRQKGLVELQGGTSGGSLPLLGGRFLQRSSVDIGKSKQPPTTTTENEGGERWVKFGRCYRRLRSLADFLRRRRQDEVGAMYSKSYRQPRTVHESGDEMCRLADQPKPRLLTVANSSSPRQRQQGSFNVVVQTEPPQVDQPSDAGMAVATSQLFRLPLKSNATQVRVDVAAGSDGNAEHDGASTPLISTGDEQSQPDRTGDPKFEDADAVRQEDSQKDVQACQAEQLEATEGVAEDLSNEITSLPERHQFYTGERRPAMTLHRVALQACMAARLSQAVKDRRERKRHQQEKKAERKAARTLSAVLLAFIVTWTPYNVFIIVEAFCADCVHPTLYAIGTYNSDNFNLFRIFAYAKAI